MPTNLTFKRRRAGDVWLVNRPRCMTSPTWTPSWRAARVITASFVVVRTRHPAVHDAEPILVEELAVAACDHEHLAGGTMHIGCSVGVRECDLREVHARDPLHPGQASDLGLQLRDCPAVGVEQRDRHVGGVRAGEKLRVRRLCAPRARDRAQRDPAGQSDQYNDRDIPTESPANVARNRYQATRQTCLTARRRARYSQRQRPPTTRQSRPLASLRPASTTAKGASPARGTYYHHTRDNSTASVRHPRPRPRTPPPA